MINRGFYNISQAGAINACNKKQKLNIAVPTAKENSINPDFKLQSYMAVRNNMLSFKGTIQQSESDKIFIKLSGLGKIPVNIPGGNNSLLKKLIDIGNTEIRIPTGNNSLLKKLIDFGNTEIRIPTGNERMVSQLTNVVTNEINPLEAKMEKLSNKELLSLHNELKATVQKRAKNSDPKFDKTLEKKALDEVLPESFALTREVCKRTMGGVRLYDEQLMAASIMHDGDICEMGTGEGKTFAIIPAMVLRSMTNKPGYVLTANDYLAEEGAIKTKPVFDFFNLNVTNLESREQCDARKEKYNTADIIYTQASEPGFDILKDFSALTNQDKLNNRPLGFAVVDEADQMMIDEATTPLIRSEEVPSDTSLDELRYKMGTWAKNLNEYEDYEINYKEKTVDIFNPTIDKIYDTFEKDPSMSKILGQNGSKDSNILLNCLNDAIRAEKLFIKDKDYIVGDVDGHKEVILVSRDTGRIMPSRRFQNGFHSALEAKELLPISPETMQTAKIIMPELLKYFDTYSGTTGTAISDEAELNTVYDKKVIAVPPHKPCQRVDFPASIYIDKKQRYFATINEMVKVHNQGRPVLIGTFSEAESNIIASLLKSPEKMRKYQTEIEERILELNSDHPHIKYIKNAVEKTTTAKELDDWVNISCSKSGFTTKLAEHLKEIIDCRSMAEVAEKGFEVNVLNNKNHEKESEVVAKGGQVGAITIANQMAGRGMDIKPSKEAEKLGGLHVIISGMHESERVYRQFEGRAGRQGNQGSSHRISSLGDDLIAGHPELDLYFNLIKKSQELSNEPISGNEALKFIDKYRKSINNLQQDIRVESKKYDEPHAKQMEVIEIFHNKLMNPNRYPELLIEMIAQETEEAVDKAFDPKTNPYSGQLNPRELEKMESAFKDYYSKDGSLETSFKNLPYNKKYMASIIELNDRLSFMPKAIRKEFSPIKLMNFQSGKALKVDLKIALTNYYRDLRITVQPDINNKEAEELFNQFEAKNSVFTLKQEWQGHLKALDDIRTAGGLKSYAGLDPLNEYKIDAFSEFGSMLHSTQQNILKNLFKAYENRVKEDQPVNPYYKG